VTKPRGFLEDSTEPFYVSSDDPAYYYVCGICHIVDREHGRSKVGFPCPVCKSGSAGGYSYFPANISILAGLAKKVFYLYTPDELADPFSNAKDARLISTVLFFCALREALLVNFIRELCLARQIEPEITERLLHDNKQHAQKLEKLFPSLTGTKWQAALKELDKDGCFYRNLDSFVVAAVRIRNRFLHETDVFTIEEKTAKQCLKSILYMTQLHVALHNKFAHPYWMDVRSIYALPRR